MTADGDVTAASPEPACENCGQRLYPTDKFCRECGLPTVRLAQAQKRVPAPPDTGEMQRALDAMPDPRPFARQEPEPEEADEPPEATTGSVVRATNPTFAFRMASSTLLMVGVVIALAAAGIVLLVLAFRP